VFQFAINLTMAVLNLLRIRNLALVEELEWQLEPGLVAITGETGAGKSIIIGALQLLLGERADKSLIRAAASRASAARCNAGNRVTARTHWMVATT